MVNKTLDSDRVQDKRTQILSAAAKIFTAKGFHQAKVEEIAAAAGVGKGTVYEYFTSKTEIFQEMLSYMLELYQQYFEDNLDYSRPVREQLYLIMTTHLHYLTENKVMFNFMLEPHLTLNKEMQEWLFAKKSEFLDGLAKLLKLGVDRGELRPIDPFAGAQILFGIMISLSGEVFLDRNGLDYQEVINHVLDILFKGLES